MPIPGGSADDGAPMEEEDSEPSEEEDDAAGLQRMDDSDSSSSSSEEEQQSDSDDEEGGKRRRRACALSGEGPPLHYAHPRVMWSLMCMQVSQHVPFQRASSPPRRLCASCSCVTRWEGRAAAQFPSRLRADATRAAACRRW